MQTQLRRNEVNDTYDAFGVLLQFAIPPSSETDGMSVFRGTLPPGISIPLHSHPEPELFYVVEGRVEIYRQEESAGRWHPLSPGETLTVAGGVKHAGRNLSEQPATLILVTNGHIYKFFKGIVQPYRVDQQAVPPSPEQIETLMSLAAGCKYWIASPEENAAIGLPLPQSG